MPLFNHSHILTCEATDLLKAARCRLKGMCAGCSSLIASCERNGKLDQAVEIVDSMHSAGLYHLPDLYVKLLEALGRQQQWEKALELFLSMQVCARAPFRASSDTSQCCCCHSDAHSMLYYARDLLRILESLAACVPPSRRQAHIQHGVQTA